ARGLVYGWLHILGGVRRAALGRDGMAAGAGRLPARPHGSSVGNGIGGSGSTPQRLVWRASFAETLSGYPATAASSPRVGRIGLRWLETGVRFRCCRSAPTLGRASLAGIAPAIAPCPRDARAVGQQDLFPSTVPL